MKISVFSNKFNVTPETVRYYINEGLLIPREKNNRYDFTEEDERDMEFLLKMKSYHFSLRDIHQLLSLKRLSNFDSFEERKDYISILREKKQTLLYERESLKSIIKDIDTEVSEISQRNNFSTGIKTGVPFQFLSHLACPECQRQLSLENCSIENQEIMAGILKCECGYCATIRDGIIVGDTGPVSSYDGADVERNCYRMMSPELLGVFQKSYQWIEEKLSGCQTKGKIILEDCVNDYCFCYTNLANLDSDALYIICDKYEEVVRLYKELIEKSGDTHNILYIAAGSHLLPLKHGCVDYYIDFDSSNEFAILYNCYAYQQVEEYLSPSAKYMGVFTHFSMNGPSIKELKRQYPEAWEHSFDSAYFKQNLLNKWDCVVYEKEFGAVTDSGYGESFTYHVGDEALGVSPYFCEDKKKN